MKIKWRKWNNAIHRDLGYFFFGMTIIYALSGIAVNHREIWNPNYIITTYDFTTSPIAREDIDKEYLLKLMEESKVAKQYKNHYFPSDNIVKVFIKDGNLILNYSTGEASVELNRRRPVFNEVNYLHYDPGKWWTWFSDIFAASLIFMAVTGLFVLRGKNGIKWRGAVLALCGLIIPIIFLLFFR